MLNVFNKGIKKCQAIIIYPTKKVIKISVPMDSSRFTVGKGDKIKSYAIDEKAIYFFEEKPMLFYHSEQASPLTIFPDGQEYTMSSSEFQSVIESKIVRDLMVAGQGFDWDITLIASIISALGVILLVVQGGGFSFLGGG